MKLKNKIYFSTFILFILLLTLIACSIYVFFSSLTYSGELRKTISEGRNIASAFHHSPNTIPAEDLIRAYVPADGMIRIISSNNRAITSVIAGSNRDLNELELNYYAAQHGEILDYNGRKMALASMPIIWSDGQVVNLQIVDSLTYVTANLQLLRNVLIVVVLLAMLPLFVSSRLLANLIVRPITSLIQTMKEIQKSGQFKRIRLEKRSRDELTEMGQSFNHMMDLLETNFEKQEQFVSNASHELKTPLTVIEGYASLLKRRGKERPELLEESIDAIHTEAIRMKGMVEQLLELARKDEQWNVTMEQVDLVSVVDKTVQGFRNAYGREINVVVKDDERLMNTYTDEQKLKQLLFIFLDNACKYSEGVIHIELGSDQLSDRVDDAQKTQVKASVNRSYVRIQDQGIGIPKEELPKVFDRFYRVDKARSRQAGGAGLGLALAKELAAVIGAEIKLDSVEGEGTSVMLSLPDEET